MKITTLQGSARRNGNTAKITSWVEEELQSKGHSVENIYLSSKNLNGCLACKKCKEKVDEIACIQNDEVIPVLEKMLGSDLIIFASPIYFWSFSSQMKTVIDRTYSLYVNYHKPDHVSLMAGKSTALLVTGAGPYENNAEGMFEAFRRMQKPHKSINAGELYIGRCSTPENLDDKIKQQCIEFAGKIAKSS